MSADRFISEARARIIWGEPALSVRDFLISNGISESVADAKIKEFVLERNREIRSIGIRNTLFGAVLTCAAGGVLLWILSWILPHLSPSGTARVYGLGGNSINSIIGGAVVLGAIAIYGLWKLTKGIIYLVRPQSEHKSIPDITQSEIIE